LALGLADSLRQSTGRDRDASAGLFGAGQKYKDATVVPVEGDEASRV
jgi:hypothetical protein